MDHLLYINWNPDVFALHIGTFGLRWYSLCWALGLFSVYMLEHKLYREQGVPEENIFLEEESHNTIQNLVYSKRLLEERGYDVNKGVAIVSNGFHLTRTRMLAGWAGYENVSTLAAPSSHLPSRLKMYIREPIAMVKSFVLDR